MLALSFTIVLELVPGDIVSTLSPINPSDPILAIASLLMNFYVL
jgi:hypothetical protein